MIMNEDRKKNIPIYIPNQSDAISLKGYGDTSGCYLASLLSEVEKNGFKYELCLQCGVYDECKHNDYSIMKIVNDKMNCGRHRAMQELLNKAEMLALVMYTS